MECADGVPIRSPQWHLQDRTVGLRSVIASAARASPDRGRYSGKPLMLNGLLCNSERPEKPVPMIIGLTLHIL